MTRLTTILLMIARLLGVPVSREESSVSGLYCVTFSCNNVGGDD